MKAGIRKERKATNGLVSEKCAETVLHNFKIKEVSLKIEAILSCFL